MKRLMMFVLVVLLAASAWATTMKCSIDNTGLFFTGKTRVESGVQLYEHKCGQSHGFWLTSSQMNS